MSSEPKRAVSTAHAAIGNREAPPPGVRNHGASAAFTIGDLAREFAISTRAIRFYEARGLLSPQRSGQNRIFGQLDRERLALIVRAKNLGLSLEEIGEHLAVLNAVAGPDEAAILKARADRQIALLESKRADLTFALREMRRLSADLGSHLRRARRSRN